MAAEHTIGRLAKAVGVNVQTVRYYERLNLLGPTARKPSGYRLYGPDEERRLRFIKNAQALGFTLHEIAELLNLRVSSAARCGDVQQRAHAKLKQVEAKVRDLQDLAKALRGLIRTCQAGQPTDRCPFCRVWRGKKGGSTMTTETRRVEVFTAGCPICADAVRLVTSLVCPGCAVQVHDLRERCATNECREKARQYGITAVPAIAVNGELLDCCRRERITAQRLTAAGIGQA